MKGNTSSPIHKQFEGIKEGDKIAYYATGDKVIVGIFEVVSDKMEIIHGDQFWSDPVGIYRLKPLAMPPERRYLDFKRLLFSNGVKFQLFPDKDNWRYVVWNHYIYPLSDHDLSTIKRALSNPQFFIEAESQETAVKVLTTRLGAPVESASLLFEPIDEMGVVYIFASYHKKLGFPFVVRLRDKFPDAIVINTNGESKLVELEFRASNYLLHKHPIDGCDYIVCWENDWEDAPKNGPKILPLREALPDIFTPGR